MVHRTASPLAGGLTDSSFDEFHAGVGRYIDNPP